MRKTLTIDDDVLATVRAMAKSQRRTMGAVLSDLIRVALDNDAEAEDIVGHTKISAKLES